MTGVGGLYVRGDEGVAESRLRQFFCPIDSDEIGRHDGSRLTVYLDREITRAEILDRLALRVHCSNVECDQIDSAAKALRRVLFGVAGTHQ